jgi:peptidoglycan/LPS O-acetylase OafA/YrhL
MGFLRCILAITVVIAHSGPIFGYYFVGGVVAVQAFYIISGFYMSLILNEKYAGKGSYKLFITNRFLRLYPIYWIVSGLTVIISFIYAVKTKGNFLILYDVNNAYLKEIHPSTVCFLLFSNIFIFFYVFVMFLRVNWSTGLLEFTKNFYGAEQPLYQFLLVPQAWTLGVELLFYMIAPFIVRRNKKIVFPLILFSIGLRLVLMYKFDLRNDPWNYRFFPTELVFFLLGNISYRIYRNLNNVKLVKIMHEGGGGGGGE